MEKPPLPPERPSTPSFVRPFLHTLNRLQERETLRPAQLTDRAQALLVEHFGASEQPTEAAFAHGSLSLIGEHTHYFDGFALMLPMRRGMAVAVRASSRGASRIVLEGGPPWTFEHGAPSGAEAPRGAPPAAACVIEALAREMAPEGVAVEAALVGTVPECCEEAYLSAVGMAAARALQALLARTDDDASLLRMIRAHLAACAGRPVSIAYLQAGSGAQPDAFILADTHTLEHLPLEAPPREKLGWGLLDPGVPAPVDAAFYRQRRKRVAAALTLLQRKGFPHVTSFRDLEHPDLQRALDVLPRRYRPLVRYLVSENRHVHKLVFAIRRKDWQMFGALLLISHACRRNDWGITTPEADFIVDQVQAMTLEGLYGGRMSGRGGSVLVVGQPFAVPEAFEHIQTAFEARFERTLRAILL
jgi:galactokinase